MLVSESENLFFFAHCSSDWPSHCILFSLHSLTAQTTVLYPLGRFYSFLYSVFPQYLGSGTNLCMPVMNHKLTNMWWRWCVTINEPISPSYRNQIQLLYSINLLSALILRLQHLYRSFGCKEHRFTESTANQNEMWNI